MAHRYRFIGEKVATASIDELAMWRLFEDEVHHLTKTLRLGNSTEVEVTDGNGHWSVGKVRIENKNLCFVEAIEMSHNPGQHVQFNNFIHTYLGCGVYKEHLSPLAFHLIMGALRPGEIDDILPYATEFGAKTVVIFQQVGTPQLKTQVLERWERILKQSIKQCKRSTTPQIFYVHSLAQALKEDFLNLFVQGAPLKLVLSEQSDTNILELIKEKKVVANQSDVLIVCGSEKGLDQTDQACLEDHEFKQVCLGSGILRAKSAAILACGVLGLRNSLNE